MHRQRPNRTSTERSTGKVNATTRAFLLVSTLRFGRCRTADPGVTEREIRRCEHVRPEEEGTSKITDADDDERAKFRFGQSNGPISVFFFFIFAFSLDDGRNATGNVEQTIAFQHAIGFVGREDDHAFGQRYTGDRTVESDVSPRGTF